MAVGDALLLKVEDFQYPHHWRFVLTDFSGMFLQDHDVSLDPADPRYPALWDLPGHLHRSSSPERRIPDQLRAIDELGSWISSSLLGRIADRLAAYRLPVTVRVQVPPEASVVQQLPLEMARIGDRPLALRDISLVFEEPGAEPVDVAPVADRLRILSVFSLPTDVSALALRRERYELMRSIEALAQTGLSIDLRVLQYGSTRDSLREVLEEEDGWDIIHISGHGERATLVLEKPDGSHDAVTSRELAELLSVARRRLKMVTLSSCLSAAATVEETLRWLGSWRPEMAQMESCETPASPMPALAQQLVNELDCAVLAMRYPVGDDFAINLSSELYDQLLRKRQPLTLAVQRAIRSALKGGYDASTPPISIATPALFGRRASDLRISPPRSEAQEIRLTAIGRSRFPPEPRRFVGRMNPLIRSSSAMAEESGMRGVLFHGMAGAGKTACALELAYNQSRSPRFRYFVWHKAPDEGKDIDRALLDLAVDMERQLPGLKMVHVLDDPEAFDGFLSMLGRILEQNSILLALDNLESLLTKEGRWRDERWGRLVRVLLEHGGLSRCILTSRRLPSDLLGHERLLVEPINALSLSESALLAREMPNLGRLMMGRTSAGLERGRGLVTRTLMLVQGHPKLIELAEAQAGDPEALERSLDRAAGAWGAGSRLEAFFESGESSQGAEEFLKVLAGWTRGLAGTLTPQARTLFHLLCALEEPDRVGSIVGLVWPDLWTQLGLAGQPTDIGKALGELRALVDVQMLEGGYVCSVHPGVAEAGLAEVDEVFRRSVDSLMAGLWTGLFQQASEKEMEQLGGLVILAGLRAAPYLMRLEEWGVASTLLEQVIKRDESTRTQAAVLPMLRHIYEATRGTERELTDAGVLARALHIAGRWQEAEREMRGVMRKAADKREFRVSNAAASSLFILLRDTGRLDEALEMVECKKGYTRLAGLGPWTQLSDEGMRLQVLAMKGEHDRVLEEVERLRARMRDLPEKSDQEEAISPWNVREGVLDVGRNAAMSSGRYQLALDLNAEMLGIMMDRGATELELTVFEFNDYGPLLELQRYKDAAELLWRCRDLFEREKDIPGLGRVFSALADLEDRLAHIDQAIRFEEAALSYKYVLGDPRDISVSHNNLANYLAKKGSEAALAHGLADGIICLQTGLDLATTVANLRIHLGILGNDAAPAGFDQLCAEVEKVEGVRFRELFDRLPRRARDGEEALREIMEMVDAVGG